MRYLPDKKVPSYWWDMEGDTIIVESDCDKFPVVARFPFDPNTGEKLIEIDGESFGMVGCAAEAVEEAEAYIVELKAGRVTPKAC
jgi:hypothetical protein